MEQVVNALNEINETLKKILIATMENGSGRAQNFEVLDKNIKAKLDEVIEEVRKNR